MWSVLRGLPVRQLMIIINLNSHHQFTNEVVYSFPRAIACFRKANSLRKTHILLQGSYISVPWSLKVMPWAGVPRCWAESTLGAQSSRACLLLSNGLWCCAWPSPQNHTHAQQPQSCCRGGSAFPGFQCNVWYFLYHLYKCYENLKRHAANDLLSQRALLPSRFFVMEQCAISLTACLPSVNVKRQRSHSSTAMNTCT